MLDSEQKHYASFLVQIQITFKTIKEFAKNFFRRTNFVVAAFLGQVQKLFSQMAMLLLFTIIFFACFTECFQDILIFKNSMLFIVTLINVCVCVVRDMLL